MEREHCKNVSLLTSCQRGEVLHLTRGRQEKHPDVVSTGLFIQHTGSSLECLSAGLVPEYGSMWHS